MKRTLILLAWLPATLLTLLFSMQTYRHISRTQELQTLVSLETKSLTNASTPFLAYAAIPEATKNITTAIIAEDARPVVIDLYLERYGSPMKGYGKLVVETAEKYSIDPYLFVAIMQQESNLGKKMPSLDCHNGWGYGIHSRGTLCFQNWEEGIETVTKGIREKFLDQGLETPQDIMSLYTPLSSGSWAEGVEQFIEELRTGNF